MSLKVIDGEGELAVTVIIHFADFLLSTVVAVMADLPSLIAVIIPVESIVATLVLLDFQVTS